MECVKCGWGYRDKGACPNCGNIPTPETVFKRGQKVLVDWNGSWIPANVLGRAGRNKYDRNCYRVQKINKAGWGNQTYCLDLDHTDPTIGIFNGIYLKKA